MNQNFYLMVLKVLVKECSGAWSWQLENFQNYSQYHPPKKLLLVLYILAQFQKQAATPSAAAECFYSVKLHGLHANTIVWVAWLVLKDRVYLHIKRILQNMPIGGVHKEQSLYS